MFYYEQALRPIGRLRVARPWRAAGRERAYLQIEKLTNLEQLPPHGFTLAAFPVSMKEGSGGWTRAVAMM